VLLDRVHVSLPVASDLFGKRGTQYLRKLRLPSIEGGILSQDPKLLNVLNKRLKETEKQIETLLRGDPRIQLLRTIPGVEPIFAALIMLEMDDKVGESITLYAALEDSSCSQLILGVKKAEKS
jgi:transposase